MRYVSALLLLSACVSLSACQSSAAQADVPARVDNPTAESRADLLRAVTGILNSSEVTLADDALTNDSLLIIEPKHLTGRDLRKPEHFQLVLRGTRCVLVHQETATRLLLVDTTCTAE